MEHACTTAFRTVILALGILVYHLAEAQTDTMVGRGGFNLNPSYRTEFIYDENLFFSSAIDKVPASYMAFTPGIQMQNEGRRTSLATGLSMTSELFLGDLESLTTAVARAEVSGGLQRKLSDRSALSANASYLSTLRPGELIPDTGLDLGRTRGNGTRGTLAFARTVSPRATLNAQYEFNRTVLDATSAATPGSSMHAISAGWSLQRSPRSTIDVRYRGDLYRYGGVGQDRSGTSDTSVSHVILARFTHQLGHRVSIELGAGPRLTNAIDPLTDSVAEAPASGRKITPDLLAAMSYASRTANLTAGYSQGQSQTFGLAGFVSTQTVSSSAAFTPSPGFSFGVSPSIFWNERAGRRITAYEVVSNVSLRVSSWVSVGGRYSFRQQEGDLFAVGSSDPSRSRNVASVALIIGRTELGR